MKTIEILYDVGDDHRIGRSRNGLYIWDRSGDDPFDTDDPPLRITGPIRINSENYRTYLTVEVNGGDTVRVSAPVAEFLAESVGVTVRFGTHRWTCDCGLRESNVPPPEDDDWCAACAHGVERAWLEGLLTREEVRSFGLDPDDITEDDA